MSIKTLSELEAFWNDFQSDYESKLGQTMTIFNYSLIHMMRPKTGIKFLELGCGPGLGTLSLYRRLQDEQNYSATITACDLSSEMINCARKRLPSSVNLQVANNLSLPFEDSSFDRVMAGMNLNLVPDAEKMLSEMFRVLQPGGRLGVSVWGRAEESFALTVFNSACKELEIEVPDVRSNFYLGTREALVPIVKKTGFLDVLSWHTSTVYEEISAEEYALTLYAAPNRREIIKRLDKDKQVELHQTLVDLINEKLVREELPLMLDGLLLVGNKPNN